MIFTGIRWTVFMGLPVAFGSGAKLERVPPLPDRRPVCIRRRRQPTALPRLCRTRFAPTLAPGDVVIMDNLSSHKIARIKEAIEATGAELLYLPPYGPDLNPIEQVLAKLKSLLRTAAARTDSLLWGTIGASLDAFEPTECADYLANSGCST
jgi:transposase